MYDGIRNNYDDRNASDMTRFALKKRKDKEKKRRRERKNYSKKKI